MSGNRGFVVYNVITHRYFSETGWTLERDQAKLYCEEEAARTTLMRCLDRNHLIVSRVGF